MSFICPPPPSQIRQLLKIELIQIWFKKVRHCFILYIVFKSGFLNMDTHNLRIICCTSSQNKQNRKQHVGVLGKVTIINKLQENLRNGTQQSCSKYDVLIY